MSRDEVNNDSLESNHKNDDTSLSDTNSHESSADDLSVEKHENLENVEESNDDSSSESADNDFQETEALDNDFDNNMDNNSDNNADDEFEDSHANDNITANHDNTPPKAAGKGLSVVAILASLLALAGSGYVYIQNQDAAKDSSDTDAISQLTTEVANINEQQNRLLTNVESSSTNINALTEQFNNQQAEIQSQMTDWQSPLAEAAEQASEELNTTLMQAKSSLESEMTVLNDAVATSSHQLQQSKDLFDLRNAISLVEGAHYQLTVFSSPKTAKDALLLAQNIVSNVNDQALVSSANDALSTDIDRLFNFLSKDNENVAQTLIDLSNQVMDLPIYQPEASNDADISTTQTSNETHNQTELNSTTTSEPQPWYLSMKDKLVGTASTIGKEIVEDLGRVVTVEEINEKSDKSFVPEEVYFLRENLLLQLQNAQHAWLQKQDNVYKANLNSAINWVNDYFNTENASVASFVTELTRLSELSTNIALPSIEASFSAFNELSNDIEALLANSYSFDDSTSDVLSSNEENAGNYSDVTPTVLEVATIQSNENSMEDVSAENETTEENLEEALEDPLEERLEESLEETSTY